MYIASEVGMTKVILNVGLILSWLGGVPFLCVCHPLWTSGKCGGCGLPVMECFCMLVVGREELRWTRRK